MVRRLRLYCSISSFLARFPVRNFTSTTVLFFNDSNWDTLDSIVALFVNTRARKDFLRAAAVHTSIFVHFYFGNIAQCQQLNPRDKKICVEAGVVKLRPSTFYVSELTQLNHVFFHQIDSAYEPVVQKKGRKKRKETYFALKS